MNSHGNRSVPAQRSTATTSHHENSAASSHLIRLTAAMTRYETGLRTLNRELADEVTACRRVGATWSQIGERLGVTKQAAQKRWGRHA